MITRMILLLLSFGLASCGEDSIEVVETMDNTLQVEAYYKENPDRFVFSSIDQLPADLNWQDGADLPEIGDPRAKRGGQLTVRLSNMQQTLRVVGPDANGSLRGPLWTANMVQLIEPHPWADGYIPGLARQWAIDPEDKNTVYLKLDPDARWSDGRPFTVEDVFFSLYLLLSPDIQDPAVNRVYDETITRITRFDDETVAITQTKPSPEILYDISQIILSQREFYRELGEDYVDRYHWRFAPVTGAYTLDESKVQRGRQITFDRIDDWWANDKHFYKHRYNPDRLTFVVIRDDNKAFEAFLRGDIDWHMLGQTSLWYERAGEQAFTDGYIERAWAYNQLPAARQGVYMNALHPLLQNHSLRLGIQHAINYEKVNSGLHRGDLRRIRSFADGYGPYSHKTLKAREFDPQKAEAYFAEAGFTQRGDDGVLVNASGQRLSFPLTLSNRTNEVTIATILKEEAMIAGLELNLDVLDNTAFFTKTFEKNHEIALHGWDTGYSPLPAFEWELRGVDAGKPSNFNTTNINDEQLDRILAEWDRNAEVGRAIQLSHEAQERVHEFAAWVPGLHADFSRIGYWRWIQWPEYFQVPRYFFFMQSGVFWIDDERREETLNARKAGQSLSAKTVIYDRWRAGPDN